MEKEDEGALKKPDVLDKCDNVAGAIFLGECAADYVSAARGWGIPLLLVDFYLKSLPVGAVGEALSKSVQLSCAFPYRLQADAAKLEALIGQLVCVKDPRGRRYLGILGSMSHVSSRFYLSYNLTITPVACEEVDL